MLALLKKSYDQPRQHIKKQRHYFANKGPSSQSYGFSSSHIWMWELDHKASWTLKNWCFLTVELEQTLESPLNCKEIKPVNPQGNQSWIVIGRIDAKAEAPTPWPVDAKNWFIGKDPNPGKDWRQEEKGMGWLHGITRSMDMSLSKLWGWWWTERPLCDLMDCIVQSWNSPGQNTWVDGLSLLQGIFPTQGSNPGLPHCRQILY